MVLLAGRDYPNSYAELRAWFNEDWKCLNYLGWLRWPDGFVCPWCVSQGGWRAPDGRWRAGPDQRRHPQPRTGTVRPARARARNLSILGSYGSEMETPFSP